MQKKLLVFAGVIIVLLFAFLWTKRGPSPELSKKHLEVPQKPPLFHPDVVQGFDWKVEKQNFSFNRNNRDFPWQPSVKSETINRLLNVLSQSTEFMSETKNSDSKELIQFSINFGKNNLWQGFWDGQNIVWTGGNLAGQFRKLTEKENSFFEAGQFAFADQTIQVCPQRIKKISSVQTPHWGILNESPHWINTSAEPKKLDGNFIEQWFSRYCQSQAETLFDPRYLGERQFTTYFEIEYQDGKKSRLEKSEDGVYKLDQIYFRSNTIQSNFDELAKTPSL